MSCITAYGTTAVTRRQGSYLIHYMCWTEDDGVTTYKMHSLPLDSTDAQLGGQVVDALVGMGKRGKVMWKELDADLQRFEEDYPDLDNWSALFDRVGISYRPALDAKNLTLDGRAAAINTPNLVQLSVSSTDAQIGVQLRNMFTTLQVRRERTSPKKRATSRSKPR